jgi:hypothetical protein
MHPDRPDALRGGCLCGAVRYAAQGRTSHPTLCHCRSCRRAAGSPAVAWFTVARTGLSFERGAPVRFHSSPHVTRGFCGVCGTPLTYEHEAHPDEVDVTTASLDEPDRVPPADHTWTSERIAWTPLGDALPRLPRSRAEGGSEPG